MTMPKRKLNRRKFSNVGLKHETKWAIDAVAERKNERQYAVVDYAIRAMIAGDESLADLAPVVKQESGNEQH